MSNATLYGFVSQKMRERSHQVHEYTRPDGGTVEVDFVAHDPGGGYYLWDDKLCVGEVVAWVCSRSLGFGHYAYEWRRASEE